MLRKTLGVAVLIGAAGAFILGVTPPSAVAGTILGTAPTVLMEPDPNVQPAAVAKKKVVKKKKNGKVTKKTVWVYNSNRHGQRHRNRNGPYAYYYGGYYYQQPWWTQSAPAILCIGC